MMTAALARCAARSTPGIVKTLRALAAMVIALPLAIIARSIALPLTISARELGKSFMTLGGRPTWSAFSKSFAETFAMGSSSRPTGLFVSKNNKPAGL